MIPDWVWIFIIGVAAVLIGSLREWDPRGGGGEEE